MEHLKKKSYREIWKENNGPIPKGMHIHHILPRYLGGMDNIENLMLVTPEEHYDIHFERGEYGAASLLSDGIDREPITKAVRQYDLKGNFIKEFESTILADNSLGIFDGKSAIRKCATYTQKSFKNYQWFYTNEVGDLEYVGPVYRLADKGGHKTFKKCKLDMDTLMVYKSYGIASREIREIKHGSYLSKETTSRLKDITKEEYYYLQELKKL